MEPRSMISRTGLFLGGLAAVLTVAVAFALNGLAPTRAAAPTATTTIVTQAAAADSTQPAVQVDTVYVPAPVRPQQIVVHKAVGGFGGEHEHEHESDGGDH
jgi:hypothetical protein